MRKNLITIGSTPIPEPSSYDVKISDIVDSARNTKGVVIGSIVREDVAKIEADFNYLTASQWSNILKLFNSKYGGSFYNDVTFFNTLTCDWETRKMYVGDRTSNGAFMTDLSTGAVVGWKGPHLSLIEV